MSQFRDEQSSALNASRSEQKIAILGGGYAGLAAAIELNRLGTATTSPSSTRGCATRKSHNGINSRAGRQAHHYEVAFSHLAERFNFRFVHKAIDMKRVIADPGGTELGGHFGAIVLAQGSHTPAKPPGVITLDQLRDDAHSQQLVHNLTNKSIAVIGGGPTGVQFAFEFAARGNSVDLYEARDRLLPTFDASLGITALKAAFAAGIRVHLLTEFLRYDNGNILCSTGGKEETRQTQHVLFVPGVKSTPSFTCDVYGRLEYQQGGKLYAVGDNSYIPGRGLNSKSAQAAVRKGQHVARTVVADLTGQAAKEYTYPELGYFVSLGPKNAVGYLLSQKTAFSGPVALFMKEAIEKQYNLYLEGLPVYP
ncbi:MAG: FAD-dependent oxidoreductase [Turneriella sp.]